MHLKSAQGKFNSHWMPIWSDTGLIIAGSYGFIVGGRMRVSASAPAGLGVRRTDARTRVRRVRPLLRTTTSDYYGIYTGIGIGSLVTYYVILSILRTPYPTWRPTGFRFKSLNHQYIHSCRVLRTRAHPPHYWPPPQLLPTFQWTVSKVIEFV